MSKRSKAQVQLQIVCYVPNDLEGYPLTVVAAVITVCLTVQFGIQHQTEMKRIYIGLNERIKAQFDCCGT